MTAPPTLDLALCRSLMFVPAHVAKFVDKAPERGADAIVLDLEDSVPDEGKGEARKAAATAARQLAARGCAVLVRVNGDLKRARADLEAVVGPAVSGIVLPKVESAPIVTALAKVVERLEAARRLPRGRLKFIVQVESVHALPNLDRIARAPRVAGLSLGADDFAATTGGEPSPQALLLPSQMLLFAARRAGIVPLGFCGSTSDYKNLDVMRQLVREAKALGFSGSFCIHPDQVAVLNEGFMPTERQLADARAIVDAYEKGVAAGRGAASHEGRMIDAPVVARARAILSRNALRVTAVALKK